MPGLNHYNHIARTAALLLAFLPSCGAFGAGEVRDSVAVAPKEHRDSAVVATSENKDSAAVAPATETHEEKTRKETIGRKLGKATTDIVGKTLGKGTSNLVENTYYSTKDFVTGKLKNYLDSSGIKGTDPRYVALPRRKWRVSLTGDMDHMRATVSSNIDRTTPDGMNQVWDFDTKMRPPVSASTGVWLGYMGYGFGVSFLKTGQENTNFSMNMTSPNYSINVRWLRYSREHDLHDWYSKGMSFNDLMRSEDYNFDITSIVFDAYWIFNKKKFSLSAAYDMSTIQLRSAGSFIAGIVYNYGKCDYAVPDNVRLLMEANGIGKMKTYQGSISGGYTYNWVPMPGLVINLTGMPVLTLYSHSRLYKYRWENIPKHPGSSEIVGTRIYETDTHSENGRITLNINARIAAAYRYKHFVFSFMAQAYYLRSYLDATTFKVLQWNMKATAGIML
jgi:hypothetical protein